MKIFSLFENITHTHVKDTLNKEDMIVFIVEEGQVGKAVGKQGANIKKLTRLLRKKIKIVEYSSDLLRFIENVVMPLKTALVTEEKGVVTITPPDSNTRGLLIGRGGANLRLFEEIVKRYYDIKEIKVISS